MFIYHFNRLIRNRLIWIFCAGLMAFSFVFVDSCVSSSDPEFGGQMSMGGEPVTVESYDAAARLVQMQNGRAEVPPAEAQKAVREILARLIIAKRCGLMPSKATASEILVSYFTGADGRFNAVAYQQFLAQQNFGSTQNFEKFFAECQHPASSVARIIQSAASWASPMEVDNALSMMFDKTTVTVATLRNTIKETEITLSDDQLKDHYEKTITSFVVPEKRTIRYVEVPADRYLTQVTVPEIDLQQYYDDNKDDLYSKPDTNGVPVEVPFDNVKEEILAKLTKERALQKAVEVVGEKIVVNAQDKGLEATATSIELPIQTAAPFSFNDKIAGTQNAADITAEVFEMDIEATPFTSVAGTNCVYLIELTKIDPEHTQTFDQVKELVKTSATSAEKNKLFEERSKAVADKLRTAMAVPGADFTKAVTDLKLAELTISTNVTFTINSKDQPDFPNQRAVMMASFSVGAGDVSEPLAISSLDAIIVYVASRTPGDELAKFNGAEQERRQLESAKASAVYQDWLAWILTQMDPKGFPVYETSISETTEEVVEE